MRHLSGLVSTLLVDQKQERGRETNSASLKDLDWPHKRNEPGVQQNQQMQNQQLYNIVVVWNRGVYCRPNLSH